MNHTAARSSSSPASRSLPVRNEPSTSAFSPSSMHQERTKSGVAQWRMVACALWLLFLGLGLGFVGEKFSSAGSDLYPTEATQPVSTGTELAQR